MKDINVFDFRNCEGMILKSKRWGDFKVLKYHNSRQVEVEFLKTGYRKVSNLKEVRNGSIKDLLLPTVYGNGFVGGDYQTCEIVNNKKVNLKHYEHWRGMLRRCYSVKDRVKFPTYTNCTVSENFKSYTYFYEWCEKQIGFENDSWGLDKDIIVKGNTEYSEDVCVFVPIEINSLFCKNGKIRGKHPIGVHFCNGKKKFVAQINRNKGQQDYLGAFHTVEEAFLVYKTAKEDFIKQVAEKCKGQIDPRAYEAMMKYEVEITD